jgi:hypothetical protein
LALAAAQAQLLPAPRDGAAMKLQPAQPPAPLQPTVPPGNTLKTAPMPATAAAQLPSAQPRSFELVANQVMSWGMPIGQPGPIRVDISAAGTPVTAWIERPDGQRLGERQVLGQATLQAQATDTEVRGGPVWRFVVRALPKTADAGAPVARGTVTLSHPPADMGRLQAYARPRSADDKIGPAAQPGGAPTALVQAEQKAMNAREDEARQARQREALQQALTALRSGVPLQKAEGARAAPALVPAPAGSSGTLLATRPLPAGAASPSVAPVGSAPAGTQTAPATAAVPTPPLTLTPARGSPGDIVTIRGSGFGTQQGSVQFTVAPGRSVPAPVDLWSDTGIVVRVPDVDGLPSPHAGPLTVASTQGAARSASFEFVPATEVRLIVPPLDQMSLGAPSGVSSNVCHPACAWGFNLEYLMFGQRGEDQFFRNARLRNGWRVEGVGLRHRDPYGALKAGVQIEGSADVSMLENRVGSDSPFLRVGWWRDAGGSFVAYWPFIQIRGPKGTPHF